MTVMLLKCSAIWLSFIPIAIINGLAREKCLAPLFGMGLALPLSGISCASLFFLLTYLSLPWLAPLTYRQSLLIGIFWLTMTVLFEFLFGRIVAHKQWKELLQAYNVFSGNLWILVLVVIAAAPALVTRLQGLSPP